MSTRDDIVAALSGVAGLAVSATWPDVVHPHLTWPAWQFSTYPTLGTCAGQENWNVYVALADGTSATAELDADDKRDRVAKALSAVGSPEIVEPESVVAADGGESVPCLRFRLVTP